jgi:hypothetical protein
VQVRACVVGFSSALAAAAAAVAAAAAAAAAAAVAAAAAAVQAVALQLRHRVSAAEPGREALGLAVGTRRG